MKFVMSYSGGKDSALALHRMLKQGHEPIGLLIMINPEMERSWFHGIDYELLHKISDSLNIPLIECNSSGADYHKNFECGLQSAKDAGAQMCVFGDIYIADNASWCRARCKSVGIEPVFPLWQEDREKLVFELIELRYKSYIKCIRNNDLPKDILGKELNNDIISIMKERNIDICGENGEYHTIVLDGPIFKYPIDVNILETLDFGNISAINITAKKT